MNHVTAGLISGIMATFVLSVLMLPKSAMGVMPDLDVIGILATALGQGELIGWLAHFAIGAGCGLIFSQIFCGERWSQAVLHGAGLGLSGWAVMMAAFMPLTDHGFFGLALPSGTMVPIATLMLHLIFGAVLGDLHALLADTAPAR